MMRACSTTPEGFMVASPIRGDSRAWTMQGWVSFGLAGTLCTIGLAYLPGTNLDRAFMMTGYAFCRTSAFALAKFIRDNEMRKMDTRFGVWWSRRALRWPCRSPAGA